MIPAAVVLPTLSDGTPITKSSEFGFEKFPTAKELPNLNPRGCRHGHFQGGWVEAFPPKK